MRVMLDGVVAGAGARGPVRFKDTVGEDRTLPDPDRAVSETRAAGADGIAVPALRLPQFGVQPQWAVAVSLLGVALVAEGPVAHLRVVGGEGQVAEGKARVARLTPTRQTMPPCGRPAGADRLSSAWLRCPLPPKNPRTASPNPSLTPSSAHQPRWQSFAPPFGRIFNRR